MKKPFIWATIVLGARTIFHFSLFTLTGAVELPVDVDVVVLPVVLVPRVVVPQAAGLGVAVARLLAPWFPV